MQTILSNSFDEANGILEICVTNRVDSTNSQIFDEEIQALLNGKEVKSICFNLKDTEYVSSACLRVFLKYAKEYKDSSLVEVNPSVYDVLDMTGFKNFYHVEKKMKNYSIDGLEIVGRGATGIVYRIDRDTIIKVFNESCTKDVIKHEMAISKEAFVHGITTAIPYEVVQVGKNYGTIYELIQSKTLAEILHHSGDQFDEIAKKYGRFMHEMNQIDVGDTVFPSTAVTYEKMKLLANARASEDVKVIYNDLFDSIPNRNTYIHGDFHPKNIMAMGDDLVLIDMGESSHGHPIFDVMSLGCLCMALVEVPEACVNFIGLEPEELKKLWSKFLSGYFNCEDEEQLQHISNVCLLYSTIRAVPILVGLPNYPEESKAKVISKIKELYQDQANRDLSIFD